MNIAAERNYIAQRLNVSKQKLTQSYLRSETDLATQNTINFKLQRSQKNTPNGTEQLLEQNDSFVITALGLTLYKIGSDTATDALRAVAKQYTYVNPSIFDGSNDANLQAIYNGFLSMSVNRVEYLPAFPTRYFERVPDTQGGTTTTAYVNASSANATTTIARDAFNNALYGTYPTDLIVLTGLETVECQITLPASVNMDESSEINTAVLWVHGYLAVNTVIKS